MPDLDPRRERYVTASQADIIVHGTDDERNTLWRECIGEIAPPDLSRVLPVQLGKHCESFILDWQQMITSHPITERQRFIVHPTLPFACTLDGYRQHDDAVIEAKTVLPYRSTRDVVVQYTPQVLIQMRCRNCRSGVLAILRGFTIEEIEVAVDASYEREVIERMRAFYQCVLTMTPPHTLPERKPLLPPELWRTIDLASASPLPNWGMPMIQSLRLWSDTREAVKLHDGAKADIKMLLPDDVGLVTYGDMIVKRAKNGSVTVREKEYAQ